MDQATSSHSHSIVLLSLSKYHLKTYKTMYTRLIIKVRKPRGFQEDNYDYYDINVAFKGQKPEDVARDILNEKEYNKYSYYKLSDFTDEFTELLKDRLGISSWNFDSACFYREPEIDLYVLKKDKDGKFLSIKR